MVCCLQESGPIFPHIDVKWTCPTSPKCSHNYHLRYHRTMYRLLYLQHHLVRDVEMGVILKDWTTDRVK